MQRLMFINVEDLPSKAQWELAVRVGNGDTKRGDGSGITNADTDTNLGALGRYQKKGGKVNGLGIPAIQQMVRRLPIPMRQTTVGGSRESLSLRRTN